MRSKRTVYNIGSNLILQIIIVIYGFIIPRIIISNYGSRVNGLVSSITQFLQYIALLDSGFTVVVKAQLYKPIALKKDKKIALILKSANRFFKKIAYIFVVYIILLAFLYPILIKDSFDYWFTFGLVIILAISTFTEYYFGMVYRMFLQAEQKNYIISILQIIIYIIAIIITLILAKLKVSILVLKLFTAVVFILRPILQNIYVSKHYNINLKIPGTYKIKNKWEGLAQHIAAVIHQNTDITILTFFCNLLEVSVYSIYYLVVKGVKSIIQAFTSGIDAVFGDMIAKKEIDNLNKRFDIYETIYNSIIVIFFSSTMILIVPFVKVFTAGITDVDYIRYTFGYLIVISEYIWAIRLPYSNITLAAGHFKETRIGAWIECISNLIISIILVINYGLIGVAIGTIFAMTIRTVEFIYHSNKYILNRSIFISIKKVFLIILETVIIVFLSKYVPYLKNINYFNWCINGLMVLLLAIIVNLAFNCIFYKKELKSTINLLKAMVWRKNDKKNLGNI